MKIGTIVSLRNDAVAQRFLLEFMRMGSEYGTSHYRRVFNAPQQVDGGTLTIGHVVLSRKRNSGQHQLRLLTIGSGVSVESVLRATDVVPDTALYIAGASQHPEWFTGRQRRRRNNEMVLVFDGPPVLCFPHALLLVREAEPGGAAYYSEAVGAMIKAFLVSFAHNCNLVLKQRDRAGVPQSSRTTVEEQTHMMDHGNAD